MSKEKAVLAWVDGKFQLTTADGKTHQISEENNNNLENFNVETSGTALIITQ